MLQFPPVLTAVTLACTVVFTRAQQQSSPVDYGVDVSFPMHHAVPSTNYAWLPHNMDPSLPTPPEYQDMSVQPLGDMKAKHEHFMNGCSDYYESMGDRCWSNERDRITMSLRQPQSMRNYTEFGFTKIRAPDHVFSLIQEFWQANKDKQKLERWPAGNIYTNHWESPTYLVSVEDTSLDGGGFVLKQHIWNAARDTIQDWTGQQLAECSLYGIRVYKEGAILSPHVDRLPLVASAIINVDQDVDEPWPLEVIGHDGIARNVTMEPGDLVLYESHSVLHSRPFPLKGRFMSNVFIHFEPIGPIAGQIEYTGDLPPYLIPGSPEEKNWRRSNPNGHKIVGSRAFATGSTEAHHHASKGDLEQLQRILDKNADLVNVRDKNGWTPLHEAVRTGDERLVELLLDRGAEVNARTGEKGEGGTALWWARKFNEEESPVMRLLKERDGKFYGPNTEL
jgi:prolyl 4-hydroxylase